MTRDWICRRLGESEKSVVEACFRCLRRRNRRVVCSTGGCGAGLVRAEPVSTISAWRCLARLKHGTCGPSLLLQVESMLCLPSSMGGRSTGVAGCVATLYESSRVADGPRTSAGMMFEGEAASFVSGQPDGSGRHETVRLLASVAISSSLQG